jgi:hypothetical protein
MSNKRRSSDDADDYVATNNESLRNQGAISFGRTLLSGGASLAQSPL